MDQPQRIRPVAMLSLLFVALAIVVLVISSTSRERGLLANTLLLAGGTLAVSMPIGVTLAFFIARTDLPGRRLFGLVLVVMLFMPLYVLTAAWLEGFGASGWHTRIFSIQTPLISGWSGAIWLHAVAAIPWVAVITAIALRRIEPQLEEAALLDAGPWQVFWHVTFRRSLPAVLAAAVWVAVLTAGEITITDVLVIRTYAEQTFQGFATGETLEEVTLGMLPTLACVTLLVLAALGICQIFLAADVRPQARAPWVYRLGGFRPLALVLVGLMMLLLSSVPLLNLLVNVGIVVEPSGEQFTRGWSAAAAWHNLINNVADRRSELAWSLVTSSVAAAVALALAMVLAWPARRGGWRQGAALLVIALCLAAPGPLVGLSLRWLFDLLDWRPWNFLVDSSILAPATALTIRALPLCTLIVWHALRSVSQKTLDAAALEGAGPVRQLLLVALPQCKTALVGAWLVGLAVAMGDLAASYLVMPPGFSTVAKRIFEDIHYGDPDEIAGITLAVMALMAAISAAAAWLLGRQPPRH